MESTSVDQKVASLIAYGQKSKEKKQADLILEM